MKTVLKTDKNYANNQKHKRIKKIAQSISLAILFFSFIFKTKSANRKIQLSEINVPQVSLKCPPRCPSITRFIQI